ncbi:BMP family ABC transporter substrate-binding protein [Candidatus Poriferisodalis sp.]|uniref:BMP family ABC transporter substrate-binding protein n=1 Tax=Candidatus Poriferisodalis sp. TaxID=3101277 RepID=UPI003B019C00
MTKLTKLLVLALAVVALLAAGCAGDDDGDAFKIGVVTDTGKVDDKSFNQSAWEGAQQAAAALGVEADYIETEEAKDYENNIGLFVEDGANVIITVGFGLGDATIAAAQANPDIFFIGVDQFQGEALPNLAGLIFPEDQSGFLAGALAGMLTETNIVGAVLGTDLVPPVVAFKEGWEHGARYTNSAVETISTYHPGGLDVAFGDPDWGAATARQALDQGADIIFGAGGATGNGALIEIASQEGAYCVGVDTDQWNTVPEAQPCLVTSAMKLITPGVADLIAQAESGDFAGGNYLGEVGLAPFHDFDDIVTDDMRATLDDVLAGLNAGEIDTGWPLG